jgi:hypothetical protein
MTTHPAISHVAARVRGCMPPKEAYPHVEIERQQFQVQKARWRSEVEELAWAHRLEVPST